MVNANAERALETGKLGKPLHRIPEPTSWQAHSNFGFAQPTRLIADRLGSYVRRPIADCASSGEASMRLQVCSAVTLALIYTLCFAAVESIAQSSESSQLTSSGDFAVFHANLGEQGSPYRIFLVADQSSAFIYQVDFGGHSTKLAIQGEVSTMDLTIPLPIGGQLRICTLDIKRGIASLKWQRKLTADKIIPLARFTGSDLPTARRFQDPIPPLQYRMQEIACPANREMPALAGMLLIPHKKFISKVIVLLGGSAGTHDRNGARRDGVSLEGKRFLPPHRPLFVLADRICRAGFAVLSMDSRGVAPSSGRLSVASTNELVADVTRSLDIALASVPEVKNALGMIVGFSGGGQIGILAAMQSSKITSVVTLGSPVIANRKIRKDCICQYLGQELGDPISTEVVDSLLIELERLEATNAKTKTEVDQLVGGVRVRCQRLLTSDRVNKLANLSTVNYIVDSFVQMTAQDWHFYHLDIQRALTRCQKPIICLFGQADEIVDWRKSIASINYVRRDGTLPIRYIVFPGIAHSFRNAFVDGDSLCTIDEAVLETVVGIVSEPSCVGWAKRFSAAHAEGSSVQLSRFSRRK